MTSNERPLSPFLHYRWQYTNTLSILHRLTGVFMTLGLVLVVYWLAAAAAGEENYDLALDLLRMPFIKFVWFTWLLSFYYHFLNGIRHLFWDIGLGFERRVARTTGWLVFISSIALTVLTWMCISVRLYASDNGAFL